MQGAYSVQEMPELLQNRLEIRKQNGYTPRTPWLCVGIENDLPLERAPAGLIRSRGHLLVRVRLGFGQDQAVVVIG